MTFLGYYIYKFSFRQLGLKAKNSLFKPKVMEKIKILFIITKSEMGGAQKFLLDLVINLNKKDWQTTVASGPDGILLEELKEYQIETVRLKHLKNSFNLFGNLLALFEIWKIIKKQKPQVLYLISSTAGFLGSLAGFFNGLPLIIYRIGGWAFKEPHSFLIKKTYLWLEKISAPFKDFIIVNSKFDFDLALKNNIAPEEKLRLFYNGLDPHQIKFLNKETARKEIDRRRDNKIKNNKIWIGTIANLYKNKGLNYLIEAIPKIKKFHLNLIIIGEGEERKNLENLIKEYRLEDSIYLIGEIEKASKFLKAFDIFVLPSIKEGQPWVILEAMAAQIPIVAANIAGIPEMIEHEKSGLLVEPADAEILAQAIEKILTHPSLAQEMTDKALKDLKAKFSLKNLISENEELFKAGLKNFTPKSSI